MIVSLTIYYVIVAVIALLLLTPFLYFRFIKGIKKGKDFLGLLLLLLIPFNWSMPPVITVTDCDTYIKDVLVLPKEGFSLGKHSYVINESKENLLFYPIIYGNSKTSTNEKVIRPGQTFDCPILSVNYILESPPSSIRIKGSGTVHYGITCTDSDTDDDSNDEFGDD